MVLSVLVINFGRVKQWRASVTSSLAEKTQENKEGNGEMILIQAVAISPYNRAHEKIPKSIM